LDAHAEADEADVWARVAFATRVSISGSTKPAIPSNVGALEIAMVCAMHADSRNVVAIMTFSRKLEFVRLQNRSVVPTATGSIDQSDQVYIW